MLRTNNCGTLNINNVSEKVTLSGWVQKPRDLGGMTLVDLWDRFGKTITYKHTKIVSNS